LQERFVGQPREIRFYSITELLQLGYLTGW
jgi:hypothetical protein